MATLRETVNDVNSPLRDYLNPKSAVTMGACSAMVLAFTTSLCLAFTWLPAAVMALLLSSMFGWAQVAYLEEKVGMKVFYGVVCTLIIFNAARGGNLAITDATGGTVTVPPAVINLSTNKVSMMDMSMDILVPSAYAGKTEDDQNRYYYWKTDCNGNAVYTNHQGKVHVEPKADDGKIKAWTWK